MWYNVGTVSLVQGSVTVTGVGTDFVSNSRSADMFVGPDGRIYEVVNYTNETTLAIKPAYMGPTISNSPDFFVVPIQGYTKLAADRLHKITLSIGNIEGDVAASAQNAAEAKAARDAADASEAASKVSEDNSKASELAAADYEQSALASKVAAEAAEAVAVQKANEAAASEVAAQSNEDASAASAVAAYNSQLVCEAAEAVVVVKADEASDSAASALASKNAAAISESNAEADATSTAADRVQVSSDKAVVLDARDVAMEARDQAVEAANTVVGSVIDKGTIDLSGGAYPAKPAYSALWKVTVAGTVTGTNGDTYSVGDVLFYSKPLDYFYKNDNTEKVISVNGETGDVVIDKSDIGLSQVDNTSDVNKPVSTATQTAITALANKPLKIAFIGDSLTQMSIRNEGWASQVGEVLEMACGVPVHIRNVGISASTWYSALSTNQHEGATKSQIAEVIEFAPDLVFMALGYNDAIGVGGFTSAQIISNAQAVVNALRAGIPSVKLIYCEESPHDPTLGTSPASLTNADTLPSSHNPISLLGFSQVRINTPAYLATALAPAQLAAHQVWGTSTTAVRAMADGWVTINLWKMARLGCCMDTLHVDGLGHTLWAWQVLTYLATTSITIGKVNFAKLNFSTLGLNIVNLDQIYTTALSNTNGGNIPAIYRGYSLYERMSSWMLRFPGARLKAETMLANASFVLPVTIERARPSAAVYLGCDSVNFASVGRNTLADGSHTQVLTPNSSSVLTPLLTAGAHTLYYGVAQADGSLDAFSIPVSVALPYYGKGATALRYTAADSAALTLNTTTYVPVPTSDHDDLGVGSSATAFTIPAALAGRKARFRASLRFSVGVTAADTAAFILCGMQRNRQGSTGNTVAAGRGLPAASRNINSVNTTNLLVDFNLNSAVITLASGDVFETYVLVSKASTSAATLLASTLTWFEMELVD